MFWYTTEKLRARAVAILNRIMPPTPRTPGKISDRSMAVFLLLFTISVIVCLYMYVLVKLLFWIAIWPKFVMF